MTYIIYIENTHFKKQEPLIFILCFIKKILILILKKKKKKK